MRRLGLALVATSLLMVGCGDDTVPVTSSANQYQTGSSLYTNSSYTSSSNAYGSSTSYGTTDTATGSAFPSSTTRPDPMAGTGVETRITDQHSQGFFHPTMVVTMQVINHDAVAHDGFVVASFQDAQNNTEYGYRYVSLAANDTQTVSITSQKSAQGATVVFKTKFL